MLGYFRLKKKFKRIDEEYAAKQAAKDDCEGGTDMFKNNIKQIRLSRNMSVNELSVRSGIKVTHIMEIESGSVKGVDRGVLMAIAIALKVSVDELIKGEEDKGTTKEPVSKSWLKELIIYSNEDGDNDERRGRRIYVDGEDQYTCAKAHMNNKDTSYIEVVDVYGAAYCIPKAAIKCIKLKELNSYERSHIQMTLDKAKK
jgi:transcriptional regulator with XRE-family HTH domain